MNGLIRRIVDILPKPLQKLYYDHEEVWLYIFYGGLTTVVSILTQYICIWLGFGTAVCTTISWIFAATFAFFVNKIYVFNSVSEKKRDYIREAAQFFGARIFSYFLELGFLLLTVDYLARNEYIMKLIAQVFVLVINYLFSKLVIFRKKNKKEDVSTDV